MTEEGAPTPPTGAYTPKRSLRNYLIDSRLQLRYAGLIVIVAATVSAALFVFLWRTSRAVVKESQTVLDRSRYAAQQSNRALEEALKVSEIKRKWYVNNPLFNKNPKLLDLATAPSRAVDDQIRVQQAALAKQQELLAPQHAAVVRQQRVMLWSVFGGLAFLVVVIALLSIYATHKVAGPLYKMKGLLKQVSEGKLVLDARLRKGDELQEFCEALAGMAEGLRARQQHEVEALDETIAAARSAGASPELLERLSRLRDELQRPLEA